MIVKQLYYLLILFINPSTIFSIVNFTSIPTSKFAKVGENITFSYRLTEENGIMLSNDKGEIIYATPDFHPSNENRWTVSPSGQNASSYTFTINKVDPVDGGLIRSRILYQIQQDNNNSFPLLVYDSNPVMEKFPLNTLQKEGDELTFTCIVDAWGSGKFGMNIMINNKILNNKYTLITKRDGNITLTVNTTVQYYMDNQDISCRATFFEGETKKAVLNSEKKVYRFLYKVRDIETIPSSSASNTPVNLKVGDLIFCKAFGNPKPHFEWKRRNSDSIESHENYLVVKKSWAAKSHHFNCSASNTINGQTTKVTTRIYFSGVRDVVTGAGILFKPSLELLYLLLFFIVYSVNY